MLSVPRSSLMLGLEQCCVGISKMCMSYTWGLAQQMSHELRFGLTWAQQMFDYKLLLYTFILAAISVTTCLAKFEGWIGQRATFHK